MSIELPHEVALFLNVMGVPYPDIDEDQVRELATQVRNFATNVRDTHESATDTIQDMGSVYSGYSYEQLVATWARMSASHMADLDRACHVVAKVLDVTAEVITAVKVAVLAGLAGLAASYMALMAATVPTMGLSAALTAAIRAAATKLVTAMEQMLIGYIATEVIGKAIEPLEHTIERMINGVVYDAASQLLDVPPGGSSTLPLHIEPDEVLAYAKVLDDRADDLLRHAVTFADNVAALDFSTSNGRNDLLGPGTNAIGSAPSRSSDPDAGRELSSTPTTPAESAREGSGPMPTRATPGGAGSADSRTTLGGGDSQAAATSEDSSTSIAPKPAAALAAGPTVSTAQERTDTGAVNTAGPVFDRAAPAPSHADSRSLPPPAHAPHNWRETIQQLSEAPSHAVENVAQHNRFVEHPPAESSADTPGYIRSPGLGSVEESFANTTDSQPSASPAQSSRQGNPPSTPWQRSGLSGKQAKGAAKSAASNRGKQRATDPATDRPKRTPWSKKPKPTPVTDPTVFAPNTARPAPALPADTPAAAPEPHNNAADRSALPPI